MALNQISRSNTDIKMADRTQPPTYPLPKNPQEQENVAMLTSIMSTVDEAIALRVLRKHGNDIERAAAALLEGDTGETPDVGFTAPAGPPPKGSLRAGRGSPVIDLTAEDDDLELARALKASLETVQDASHAHTVNFGPSTRAPDPNWAMVPTNVRPVHRSIRFDAN